MAVQATLHCLTGCAIGEVLGMVLGTAWGWSNFATVVLSIVLAFVFGYALSLRSVLASGVDPDIRAGSERIGDRTDNLIGCDDGDTRVGCHRMVETGEIGGDDVFADLVGRKLHPRV